MNLPELDDLDRAIRDMDGDPVDVIIDTAEIMDRLRGLVQSVADTRRRAVRQLRADGWTLKQIAAETHLTISRVAQIEGGYNRQERKARSSQQPTAPPVIASSDLPTRPEIPDSDR